MIVKLKGFLVGIIFPTIRRRVGRILVNHSAGCTEYRELADIYLAENRGKLIRLGSMYLNRRSLSQVSTPRAEKVNVGTNVNLRFTLLLFSPGQPPPRRCYFAIYRNSSLDRARN